MARYLGEPICFRLQTSIVQLCHKCALIRRQRFVLFLQAIVFPRKSKLCPSHNCRMGFLFLWLSLFTRLLWRWQRSEEIRIPAAGKTEDSKHLRGASASLTFATPPLFFASPYIFFIGLVVCLPSLLVCRAVVLGFEFIQKFVFHWVIHDSCQRELLVS